MTRPPARERAGRLPQPAPCARVQARTARAGCSASSSATSKTAASSTVTTEHALAWATLPAGASAALAGDPAVGASAASPPTCTASIPPSRSPGRACSAAGRAGPPPTCIPMPRSPRCIEAPPALRPRLRAATYRTPDRPARGHRHAGRRGDRARSRRPRPRRGVLIVVRNAKFGKRARLPLHPSDVQALRRYLQLRDRAPAGVEPGAVRLRCRHPAAPHQHPTEPSRGSPTVPGSSRARRCRPRIHDLRHRFAVVTMLDWYRGGSDVSGHSCRCCRPTSGTPIPPTHTGTCRRRRS